MRLGYNQWEVNFFIFFKSMVLLLKYNSSQAIKINDYWSYICFKIAKNAMKSNEKHLSLLNKNIFYCTSTYGLHKKFLILDGLFYHNYTYSDFALLLFFCSSWNFFNRNTFNFNKRHSSIFYKKEND